MENREKLKEIIRKIIKEEKLNEELVSFDRKEVLKRSKTLFPLLGDYKDNSVIQSKLVSDILSALKKYSSLKSR